MDFTNKHKIGAIVIGSILLIAVLSPTVLSIILKPEAGQVSGREVMNKSNADSKSDVAADPEVTDVRAQPGLAPGSRAAGDGVTQEAESARADLRMSPEQAVAEAKLGEELGAVAGSDAPSNCKSSIEAYRDTLISQEKERWSREQREIQERVDAEVDRAGRAVYYAGLIEAGWTKHLETLKGYESQYEFMLNQHGCR